MGGAVQPAGEPVAVVYLARGADVGNIERFGKFLSSYRRFAPGADHRLFIIFKGYDSAALLQEARLLFQSLDYDPLFTTDSAFDVGAYVEASRQIPYKRICFLNTASEIVDEGWLAKLSANLAVPRVGIVGATGSYESLKPLDPRFPGFPNPHVRSNAFMIQRSVFLDALGNVPITSKTESYFAESGLESLTRRIIDRGQTALLVGRDGRGYAPDWWPGSHTFRQGSQHNLLIHDNQTRNFDALPFNRKLDVSRMTWGDFIKAEKRL